jgi:glycine dehydrogenase subunit 1
MSYLYATEADRRAMLEAIGVDSIQQLIDDQVPKELQMNRPLDIAPGVGELELTRWMRKLAARNQGAESMVCFLGGGAYDHFIPAAVDQIAARGEWYTSYTPYQAEVSQGNLQAMFEYESLVCELTGMDVSNASVYEGATAAVEAALMCLSLDANRRRVVVSEGLHPHTRQALQTYLQWIDGTLVVVPVHNGLTDMASWEKAIDDKTACVLVSQPNYLGSLEPVDRLVAPAKKVGAQVIAAVDPISLGVLKRPGDWGADLVVAEGQPLGNPLAYGGPYLGILACRDALVRRLPGRIAGQTEDRHGNRCWVLTLQTREQHIRREKATSNICTNQGLLALRATIYLSLQGPQGLRATALQCGEKGEYLKSRIRSSRRVELAWEAPTWRECVVRDRKGQVESLLAQLRERGMLGGIPLADWDSKWNDCFLVAVTEKRTKQEIDALVDAIDQVS